MFERNNDKSRDNTAQNCFTAYLLTAITNARITYLRKRSDILAHESSFETMERGSLLGHEPDLLEALAVVEQIQDDALLAALRRIRARDLHIVISKIVNCRSLHEIGGDLGLSYNTVSTAYHRAMRRIRKGFAEYGGWV